VRNKNDSTNSCICKESGNRKQGLYPVEDKGRAEALPFVEKMYITEIDLEVEGDTYFPKFNEDEFVKEIDEEFDGEIPYTYVTYTRKCSI